MKTYEPAFELILSENTKINIYEPGAVDNFSRVFKKFLEDYGVTESRDVILLCIGTDRSTGDSFGPLVGSKIASKQQDFFKVYGTLDHPVHASNLSEVLKEIYENYEHPFIVALDACLGNMDSVGCVSLGSGSLQPGAGVNKNLPPVGNIYITGIVNVGGFMEYLVLQNTRLNLVMRMADAVVEGLSECIPSFTSKVSTV